ncbi:MAG: NAD(P)H-binding protein [Pseudomonadota bacterium]
MTQPPPVRTALLAGATGAVGSALLTQLLADARYGMVKVLVRRPLGISHQKLVELTLSDSGPALLGAKLLADDVFCCLGTTQKKAGSRAAFERVDYHLVLELARAALAQGAQQFLVVSSVGAALKGASFYLRVKARMEQAVLDLGYQSAHILRPSLLIAKRRESRRVEWLAQKLAPLVDPLLQGKLGIYRTARAEDVAAAMLTLALRQTPGGHTHHLPLAA